MLLRITSSSGNLHDSIIIHLDKLTQKSTSTNIITSTATRTCLIKLLCHWCINCGTAVKAILAKPESVCVFQLLEARELPPLEQAFAALLVGIWLEHLGAGEHSGWSRSTLLGLIRTRIGLSHFTKFLEQPRESNNNILSSSSTNTIDVNYIKNWYVAKPGEERSDEPFEHPQGQPHGIFELHASR